MLGVSLTFLVLTECTAYFRNIHHVNYPVSIKGQLRNNVKFCGKYIICIKNKNVVIMRYRAHRKRQFVELVKSCSSMIFYSMIFLLAIRKGQPLVKRGGTMKRIKREMRGQFGNSGG